MKDIIEPVDTDDGLFHDGDPSTGAEGTIVYAKIMNALQGGIIDIQTENKNILAEAKMKLDSSKNNQLITALKALFLGNEDPRIDGVLQKDKNLSDLNDKNAAKEALSLDKVGNYSAIQQGGGTEMKTNKLYVGWNGAKLIAQVDNTALGDIFYKNNPPTASQCGAYPVTGGKVNGEIWSEVVNNFRIVSDSTGAFWRFDGSNAYLMFTNKGDAKGGYNSLRPLTANASTGDLSTNHHFRAGGNVTAGLSLLAGGNVQAGNGTGRLETDGNIYGSVWGGFLSNFLASNWNNAVYSARRGGQQYQAGSGTGQGMTWESPAGCFLTGIDTNVKDGRGMGVYFRRFQLMNKTGGWWEIGD
ncbi:hypothetical protein [Pantoea sp.]|uniref:phage tail fiber protein n=1 Tax=Pantoea sp. TaxID=69393 RepID=UPI002898D7B2|nr:hypothetical protein [Pantoea sp.]